MYCPKCKESFDEGSRRFCPTDGSRLISETAGAKSSQSGGIFANLIPKIEGLRDLDETASDLPRFVITEAGRDKPQVPKRSDETEAFFELDDLPPPPIPQVIAPKPVEAAKAEPPPIARKIKPFEIPAGHVDLSGPDRIYGMGAEFDRDDPERFVGRFVKGRYKVTEFLGDDETGLAYLADDRIVEDKKVMVRILTEDGYDEILSSILAEERVSLSHFSHPNVARLIDSGQFTNGTNFLISEHIDSLSVDDILSIHGRFSPLRTARVIRQAASALNEAHQEGIIHRDIRPDNLVIDTSMGDAEQAKVVSFGASNGDPNEYNIAYKAPEVLEGRIATVASDIYSLAVVAYEMLTGRMPFSGSTATEIARSQYAGLLLLPTGIHPDLPRSVDDVMARALAYNAAERYPKARDLGDALYAALTESQPAITADNLFDSERSDLPVAPLSMPPPVVPAIKKGETIFLEPAAAAPTPPIQRPAWMNRSQEPPEVGTSRAGTYTIIGIFAVFALVALGWYFFGRNPIQTDTPQVGQNVEQPNLGSAVPPAANTEMPPLPRTVKQPENSTFYQNTKQNLKGDLLRNFVGFSVYYPKDWKINGPQEGATANARGKFLDIARSTPDGRLKEQMLVSYYASKGTYTADADKFPQMVKETNETLKKLLPGYQMVSEGEIKINGAWRAYEIKFQGGGESATGEKLIVWGRRIFIPAARPGVRNGFEITMLATSASDEVRSVDDIGVKGELASILYTFEPSQNF